MILEIYKYLPAQMVPKAFPDMDFEEIINLHIQAKYMQELECLIMQKAIAQAFDEG